MTAASGIHILIPAMLCNASLEVVCFPTHDPQCKAGLFWCTCALSKCYCLLIELGVLKRNLV